MIKENEAGKLWCPMSRVAQCGNADISTTYNRTLNKQIIEATVNVTSDDGETKQRPGMLLEAIAGVSKAANCIGSKCAMWRWADKPFQVSRTRVMCNDPLAVTEPARPDGLNEKFVFIPCDEDVDAHWAEPEEVWLSRRRGYCGLAGRPEVMP